MALGQLMTQSLSHYELHATSVARTQAAQPPASLSKNINRLLSAAVVSQRFQRLLLADPAKALSVGYNGESFHLTPVEYAAVTSLRAGSIREFAAQLLRLLQSNVSDGAKRLPETQGDFRFAEIGAD